MTDLQLDDTDGWLIQAARELDPPTGEVERLISSITTTVTKVIRPARALTTDSPGILVSDRVVKTLLATAVRSSLGRLVVHAQVLVDDDTDTVRGVRVGLVARYRDDLPNLSERVRDVVENVLTATLGGEHSAVARTNVHVRWQDVYSRDWLN